MGTILMSTQSGQKSFKVLSERLTETSKGRKTKAHPSPGPLSAPPNPHPRPRALTRPWMGPRTPSQGHPGGLRILVSHKNPNPSPKTHRRGGGGGAGGGEARVPVEGENIMKEKNLRKRYPRFCDASYIYIYISVYMYVYMYIWQQLQKSGHQTRVYAPIWEIEVSWNEVEEECKDCIHLSLFPGSPSVGL